MTENKLVERGMPLKCIAPKIQEGVRIVELDLDELEMFERAKSPFLNQIYSSSLLNSCKPTTGDNPSAEAHPTDDSEVPVEIIPEDVLLRYFGSVEVASPPALFVGIHRERVDESLARGIPTNKEKFHALRASLLRLSKEIMNSPVLATTYNDMALALGDLFSLHRTTIDSHDEVIAALQHLGSHRQEKNHIQTSFNEVNAERQQNVIRRNDLQEQLSKLRVELERIQAKVRVITSTIGTLDSAIGAHDSSRSSLFRQSLQLDNKIRELGNQQVVWELDQRAGSEWLAKLENEWTEWKSRLVQAMSKITTPLPADPVAELSADTLMDLQFETIVAYVFQEVLVDTQDFTEAPSTVVAEPLMGAERVVQAGAEAAERSNYPRNPLANYEEVVPNFLPEYPKNA
ncbi:hypothetical protein RND71_025584 [Anisodus tanguticus]|uniref:Uncharacterized protein n=1 Tax=Anisodus tanguticus TaxID=243964 RepID=A0AAE1RTB6_9SOLA|nr:hypothetical protein RND71_025584 [Anisodus tanguticus]